MKLLYICLTLLLFSITAKAANTNITAPEIKTLSAASPIKYKNDTLFSVIKVAPLYTTQGVKAYGEQTINFYLHSDAPMSVKVGGNVINPGETITFKYPVNNAGGLDIPINSNMVGVIGDALFTMTIDEIKALSCPAGYTMYQDKTCRKWVYQDINGYQCSNSSSYRLNFAEGEGGLDPTKCYGSAPYVPDANYVCPDGYKDRGWGVAPHCTDVDAYVSEDKAMCEQQGGSYAWDGSNTVCSFRVPISIEIPRICSKLTVYSGQYRSCVDTSMVRDAVVVCPTNYRYDSYRNRCERQLVTNPS